MSEGIPTKQGRNTHINEADKKHFLSFFIVAIETPWPSLLLISWILHIFYLKMQIGFHKLLLIFHLYLQYCYTDTCRKSEILISYITQINVTFMVIGHLLF